MTRCTILAAMALLAAPAALAQPSITEYHIPTAFPHDPAVDAAGGVWYTDQANSRIGRLDPETVRFTDWPTPSENAGPHGITVAPDGDVWYTGNSNRTIGRRDQASGEIREYRLPRFLRSGSMVAFDRTTHDMTSLKIPTPGAIVRNIAVDRTRGRIWLAESGAERLGRIDVPPEGR